jgi:hypothetical protein
VNLEKFWDGWMQTLQPALADRQQMEGIFSQREIHYQHDHYEHDNDTASANLLDLNVTHTHHLYSHDLAEDVDVFRFALQPGQTYSLKTFDLRNGADTNIKVVSSQGALIAANDDAADAPAYVRHDSRCNVSRVMNNGTALASKVEFTVPTTGTYFAEVSTTPDPAPHPSAGKYGSYSISLSKP